MKNIKRYTAIFLLAIIGATFLSCSSDDDNSGTQVRYVLTMPGSSVVVTGINYRNSAGQMVEGFGSDESDNNWTKTVNVDKPFNAAFQINANNVTDATLAYTIAIFVNGTAVATKEGSIPPQSGNVSDNVSFDVE